MPIFRYLVPFTVILMTVCTTSCNERSRSAGEAPANASRTEATLDVRCQLLELDADFLEVCGDASPEGRPVDQYVLTDIETFFFLQTKNRPRPQIGRILPGTTTLVHDDVAPDGRSCPIHVTWSGNGSPAKHELVFSAPVQSEFRLNSTRTAVIPDGGSVILRDEQSGTVGKTRFLWITAANSDSADAARPDSTRGKPRQ